MKKVEVGFDYAAVKPISKLPYPTAAARTILAGNTDDLTESQLRFLQDLASMVQKVPEKKQSFYEKGEKDICKAHDNALRVQRVREEEFAHCLSEIKLNLHISYLFLVLYWARFGSGFETYLLELVL